MTDRLAILGGIPVRNKTIYYGHQYIDDDDISCVEEVLKGDYITCGPYVKQMERMLEQYLGVKHVVAVSNGTAALHLACIVAGISCEDEVITSPLTFVASANCVLYCGGKPVFADINPYTYCIDSKSIRNKITSKTKAIIAVDYTGQTVEIDEIRKICDEHGLIFIEDAAHSFATEYKGKKVGTLADMTCFSFHPVKTITSGEGGAIATNDDMLYSKLLLAHEHGITHDSLYYNEKNKDEQWYYEQVMLGYNYRMTDIQAALLMSQLGKINMFKNRRKQISKIYDSAFKDIPEIILQKETKGSDTCRHLYTIRLNSKMQSCTRKEFYDAMRKENIQCQIHYIPVYWFEYYKNLGYRKGECPNAEMIYENILSIPLYPAMTDEDVKDVICAIKKVVNYYKR